MIRLYNVIDVRTGKFYSVAVVSQNMLKYFEAAEE